MDLDRRIASAVSRRARFLAMIYEERLRSLLVDLAKQEQMTEQAAIKWLPSDEQHQSAHPDALGSFRGG